jgi:hypothetical protein
MPPAAAGAAYAGAVLYTGRCRAKVSRDDIVSWGDAPKTAPSLAAGEVHPLHTV